MIRLLVWAVVTVALAALGWHGRTWLTTDLRTMLPSGDGQLARELAFFAGQGEARMLAIEAWPAAGGRFDAATAQAAREDLLALIPRLGPLGAAPLDQAGAASMARAATLVLDRLPELTTPEALRGLDQRMEVEALTARLAALKEHASRPDADDLVAVAARSDLLAIAGDALRAIHPGPAGAERDGPLFAHAGGGHLMLPLTVDFDPGDMDRSDTLMDAVAAAAAAAAGHGIHLEAVGSYRHFHDNMATVRGDLASGLTLCFVLVAAILASLIRDVRALVALHVPALLGVLGAFAGAVLWGLAVPSDRAIPMSLLGFAAGVLGVTVDYGTHMVVAIRAGHGHAVRWPLAMSVLTTAAAFAVLLTSDVAALRCIGAMMVSGEVVALAATLWLLPVLCPRPALLPPDPWRGLSGPLVAWSERLPRRRLALAGLITLILAPGLGWLRFEEDPRRYDASRPETWQAVDAFIGRWGGIEASDFLSAVHADRDLALDRVATARATIGEAPGIVERLLPSRAEQARRIAAWNGFWAARADAFAAALASACQHTGLRFAAFAPTLERYRPLADAPRAPLTLEHWANTPVAASLATAVRRDGEEWLVASALDRRDRAAVVALRERLARLPADHGSAARAPGGGPADAGAMATVASRGDIGARLVEVMRSDLADRSLVIALAMLALVAIAVRRPRVIAAIMLPPVLAMAWTFGALGWAGQPLTPFSLLAAAFVGGIGIDSAIFLATTRRSVAMSPILAAVATTVLGVGSMATATHPVISAIGITLAIGMSACLVACLLVTPALTPVRPERGT